MTTLSSVIARGLRAVYQPIVDLRLGRPVGFEAMARGPAGSALESPAALFAAAREEGALGALDRACRIAALRGALRGGLGGPLALFINVEPSTIGAPWGDELTRLLAQAHARRLRVFMEVTERALTADPAALLESVEGMRTAGLGIALDDVGADSRSLALLALVRPDVVKLDISLIHGHPSRRSGEVMNGVCAYAEQTGAAVVAEGIEDERHLLAAQSLGAGLAQGWYFGMPGELRAAESTHLPAPARLGLAPREVPRSPVELVHSRKALRVGRKDVLLSVTRALEAAAAELGQYAVVVSCFQSASHFTPSTRRRYEQLAARTALTVALGAGMPASPARGVRGADLSEGDPLRGEWDVAVLAPHYAGALVGRDLGDRGADLERRFEYALTFDRELVVDVAATLIARVSAALKPPVTAAA